jgi:hypothetical protein
MIGRGESHALYHLMEPIRVTVVLLHAMRLQSSAIEVIAYDENAHILTARFREGGITVIYEDVPQEIYDGLIFAKSVGGYFHDKVEGRFPQRKH